MTKWKPFKSVSQASLLKHDFVMTTDFDTYRGVTLYKTDVNGRYQKKTE